MFRPAPPGMPPPRPPPPGPPPPGPPPPGLPGLPGLPGIAGLSALPDTLAGALTGGASTTTKTNAAPAAAPGLPPELAALVDVGGFSSTSRTDNDDLAFAQGRSVASDISLLGGLVTIDSVSTVANATSDGVKGTAKGTSNFGTLTAFGQKFSYGSEGFEAVGQTLPIPGLPDDATKALEQIGLTISLPKPIYTVDGDAAKTVMPGLVIDFDLTVLRTQLLPVIDPLNELLGQLPEQAAQLTGLLQAAANLSPRVVVALGYSTASVDTSQAIPIPPPVEPTEEPTEETTEDAAPAPGGDGGPVAPGGTDTLPGGDTPTGETPASTETQPVSAAQQPGLPPLFSFPGLLLYGGILGAGIAGIFTRRLGLAALGGGAACAHGLDSGLPDLRKVT